MPTSVAGVVSVPLSLGGFIVPAFALLFLMRPNKWWQTRIPYLLFVFAVLFISTLLSPFDHVAWGGLAPYILISIVLLIDFKSTAKTNIYVVDALLLWVFISMNIFVLIFGFGTINNNTFLIEILEKNYQSINDVLFEQMVLWYLKPVTIFGSHSTAAFVYLALFSGNLKFAFMPSFGKGYRLLFLLFSFGFVILNNFLNSNASLVVSLFMVGAYAICIRETLDGPIKIVYYLGLFIGLVANLYTLDFLKLITGDSADNGILSRYVSGGRLQSSYDYLVNNYFIPIGISYSPEISFGDNFIGEYVIKISVFGYIIIMYLLWTWLRRNLAWRSAVLFFGFFFITDLAYPLLVYSRVAAVLPFFVLLWSRLDSGEFLKKMGRKSSL